MTHRERMLAALGGEPADRIESRSIAYHRRVRQGFRQLAEAHPESVTLVAADASVEVVHARVMDEVDRVL